ncbi:MAG TPA: hypothetical protein EYG21_03390 [Nitrospinaceae bacterium]|nr:hypothetical protein [Nitrospinaceae bacterium]
MEYLDGERPLRMHLSSLNGRRSNCMLPNTVVEKLSERVEESACYSTRGGVISLLLQDFLAQQDDGAGAFKVLNKLLQACEEKDRGGDVFSYHEALLEARKLLRQGE